MKQNERNLMYEKWQQQVQDQQNSGLSISEWCKQNNMNRTTFYRHSKIVKHNPKMSGMLSNPDSVADSLSFASIEFSKNGIEQSTGILIQLKDANIQIAPDANENHIKLVLQELFYA